MAIADKLRKAASLFVEMPEPSAYSSAPPDEPAAPAAATEEDDLDRRLAQMNQTLKGMSGGATLTTPASEPAPAVTTATPAAPKMRTINDLLTESSGPNLEEIQATASDNAPPLSPDGTVDFAAIYQKARLPAAPFTAEQMLDMLGSLPESLPLDMKRQTVNVTIGAMGKAIGATPETIVADASRKLAALAGYAQSVAKQAGDFSAGREFEIAALLAQVEEKRAAIKASLEQQASVQARCDAEADRLDDVLEFFSLDIGPSKYAAPHTPPTS